MPWSETCPMEQRIRFVLEALEGWDSMSEPCARYGISRRVGYKWLDRYRRQGLEGLADRSRAPHRQRAATSPDVVEAIVALRKEHPTWGPRKLKAWLERNRPRARWPACSTIGSILKRGGSRSRPHHYRYFGSLHSQNPRRALPFRPLGASGFSIPIRALRADIQLEAAGGRHVPVHGSVRACFRGVLTHRGPAWPDGRPLTVPRSSHAGGRRLGRTLRAGRRGRH